MSATSTTAEGKPRRNSKSVDFDREMGAKLRTVRISADMTQTELGRAIGVSFQQVQKYETGKDRIAAGTLQTIGAVLGVHPGEFFGETSAPSGNLAELREAMSIAATMRKITSPSVRKRFGIWLSMTSISRPLCFRTMGFEVLVGLAFSDLPRLPIER